MAEAFEKAVETAYKAVMKPMEGTILTVARNISEKASDMKDTGVGFEEFSGAILEVGQEALDKTPELLPVLKEAGVVDSGGAGLLEILKGARDALLGKEVDYSKLEANEAPRPLKISKEVNDDIKFGYCTEFIIVLDRPLDDDEITDFKAFLNGIGDSIVFVPDDEIVKIHVHTNEPGNAIQKALGYGSLSRIKIDNMREEHQERLFKDSLKLAREQKEADEKAADKKTGESFAKNMHKENGFVAVCAGEGMTEIFKDLGTDRVIMGGQTMNPSTDDIVKAAEKIDADNIFILPNNKNIIMAANQAKDIIEDKNVIVIETKTIPQGIAALISFTPDIPPDDNKENMKEAIDQIRSAQVTYAVRDTTIEGKSIEKDDYMAIGDDGLLASGKDLEDVVISMIEKMADDDSEIISLYYGADIDGKDAQTVSERLREKYPDCEIEVNDGGQPVYYYIASVE